MIQYKISVISTHLNLEVDNLKNVVYKVSWIYQAKEDFHVADLFKDTLLSAPKEDDFINFNDLNEEIVTGWITSIEDMESLKEQVNKNLQAVKNPLKTEIAVPWNKLPNYTEEEFYVITNAGTVVSEPTHWNSHAFNQALVPYGFTNPLPANAIAYRQCIRPINEPLDLGNQTKIYQAVFLEHKKFDESFYKLGKLKWSFDTGVAVAEYPIVKLSVPEIQARLTTILKKQVDHLSGLGHTVNLKNIGYEIFPNHEFANTIVSKIIVMNDTDITNWYQGPEIKIVNRETLQNILIHVNILIDQIQTFKTNKIKEINESKTLEQLQSIILVP